MDKKKQRQQRLILLIILVGLFVVTLAIRQVQDLRGRAVTDLNAGLSITDEGGDELEYQGGNTYKTHSQRIRIGIRDLEQLK